MQMYGLKQSMTFHIYNFYIMYTPHKSRENYVIDARITNELQIIKVRIFPLNVLCKWLKKNPKSCFCLWNIWKTVFHQKNLWGFFGPDIKSNSNKSFKSAGRSQNWYFMCRPKAPLMLQWAWGPPELQTHPVPLWFSLLDFSFWAHLILLGTTCVIFRAIYIIINVKNIHSEWKRLFL